MVLGISEDFTSNVSLDSQLTTAPESGLFLNSGVHPVITIKNLLDFLPYEEFVFADWSDLTTYSVYEDSRNKKDIVSYNGKIYQSIKASNLNESPDTETEFWLETNIESIRLKTLVFQVLDRVYYDLNLTKRLVNNQFIYEVGENTKTLPSDYAAWVFEPKGSDYVTMRINQVSFQKEGVSPVNLYVINQGVLVDTLVLTPSNGVVDFKDLGYTFKGKGSWTFAIDSTDVIVNNYTLDPYKYDGFTCYTATGTGTTPEDATYSYGTFGNGLGFNVSAYLDSSLYVDNNINELANFVRAAFEYVVFNMFLSNSNARSNRSQKMIMDNNLLVAECKDIKSDTVCYRYYKELKEAKKLLNKTFDTQLFLEDNNIFQYDTDAV